MFIVEFLRRGKRPRREGIVMEEANGEINNRKVEGEVGKAFNAGKREGKVGWS